MDPSLRQRPTAIVSSSVAVAFVLGVREHIIGAAVGLGRATLTDIVGGCG